MTPLSESPVGSTAGGGGRGRARWDAVVVGAGPAGALTAGLLARAGASTLLVDRADFPRWTVCGACLGPAALAVLDDVGWAGILDRAGSPRLDRMEIRGWSRRVELPLRGGRVLSRARLDAGLAAAAEREGAVFRPGTAARLGPVVPEGREVRLADEDGGEVVRAKVVVAATGLHPLPGEEQGPDASFRRAPGSRVGVGAVVSGWEAGPDVGTVRMTAGAGGYVGQVRQEDGRWAVAAALDPSWIRRHGGMEPGVQALLDEAGIRTGGWVVEEGWRGTPSLTGGPSRRGGDRVLRVGDAAGYVEPFTGEGMGWALVGALALAPVALDVLDGRGEEGAWDRLHQARVGRRQSLCRAVAGLSRRPAAAAGILSVLQRAPWLARPALSRAAWTPEHSPSPKRGDA